MSENPQPTTTTRATQQKVGKYVQEIQAMMYTFGDVRNAMAETAELIEDILHSQLVDIILKAAGLAQRRGSKSVSPDDLMFVIRHDTAKLRRLREFLNWKDVRKNVKQPEETNVANAAQTLPFDVEGVVGEEEEEDAQSVTPAAAPAAAPRSKLPPDSSAAALSASRRPSTTAKQRKAHYYWDYLASLVAEGTEGGLLDTEPIDLDEEPADAREEGLRRLREADRMTRSMSKAEYMEYTECRQASFTYKKAKKFRDWLGIPMTVTEYRLSDDVLEILGFLAAETVRQVTEGALKYGCEEPARREDDPAATVFLFKAPLQRSPIRPAHLLAYLTDLQIHAEQPNSRSRIKLY